jgi:hypothetical protein
MSPRTIKRRRRRNSQAAAAAGNGSPATLLTQVSELVNENQALVRENKELHSILVRVTEVLSRLPAQPVPGNRPGVRRTRRASGSRANGHPRQRRKITDPASLEKRRAALSKARQVLAEKRAAGKASE